MTWEQLGAKIAQMTPEQRTGEVKYVEPYDATRILPVSIALADEVLPEDEEEGNDKINLGEWYLY